MNTPFYMTYPIQNLYQAEMEYEQDQEKLRATYTPLLSHVTLSISDYCDEMEQEGNRIFDEYPDKWMLQKDAMQCARQVRQQLELTPEELSDDMALALYLDEVYRRRCRYHRQHRWW